MRRRYQPWLIGGNIAPASVGQCDPRTDDHWRKAAWPTTSRKMTPPPAGSCRTISVPSNGAQTDDVPARLNAGEFVIPKDVAEWKGQEFFYKLMAQARAIRAKAGSETGTDAGYQDDEQPAASQPSPDQGFAYGGAVGYGAM